MTAAQHTTQAHLAPLAQTGSASAALDLSTAELEQLVSNDGRRGWKRTARPYLVLSDLAAITVALALVPTPPMITMIAMYVGVVVTLTCLGAYRSRLTLSCLDDLPVFLVAALVGGFAQLTMHTVVSGTIPARLVVQALAVAVAVSLARAVSYAVVREARRRGLVEHRALILGAGEVGRELAQTMLDHPEYGLRPVGFLDTAAPDAAETLPVPLLGAYDDLARCVRREGVSEVVVAFGASTELGQDGDHATLAEAVRQCDRLGTDIFSVPRFHDLHRTGRDMDQLWATPLVRLRRNSGAATGAMRAKRAFDIVAAGTALLILAPLMALTALMVRIENGPGVLFRQTRVGLDGFTFTVLKFRSVRPADLGMTDGKPVFSVNGHAGLGTFSRFMRKVSLDELPQLINIVRGDMTIVGPRPERDVFVDQFSQTVPRYAERHRMPVGLTGWAQVNGLRGNTSIEERVRFDNSYIQNWSLWLDVKIIARTVSTVLFAKGS